MTEKRKLSTRNRGEPPLKKRQSSPPPPPPPPPPVAPAEEGLPTKLKDGQPLPILPEQQEHELSMTDFQSIAERSTPGIVTQECPRLMCFSSGVLAAAIERSRHKWLSEGVFEKYWAKPSKKKTQIDTPNPAKESMAKLGVCSMIIEPHVFEITLYTVKESQPTFPPANVQTPPPPSSEFNPFQNHNTYQTPLYHAPLPPAPRFQHHTQLNSNPSQLTLPPFKEGFGQFGPQGSAPLRRPPAAAPKSTMPERQGPPEQTRPNESTTSGAKPSPDPVIQMLATRAASDHNLKALMKVVASGNASQKQLRDFQNHIDDLNGLLKSGSSPSQPMKDPPVPKPPPNSGPEHKPQSLISTSTLGMAQSPHPPPITHPIPPTPIKSEPLPQYFSHVATPPRSKAPTAYRSDISAIVFDFGGSGDRFLFPRFSILEYLPGGTQVIVSFLIIRTGSLAASGTYSHNSSYYQPVTMRLSTPHPKTLEPLSRIVAPPEDVRNYMNSVFDKMNRAENVFLATRLPRPSEGSEVDKVDTIVQADHPIIKPLYSPPNGLIPLKV